MTTPDAGTMRDVASAEQHLASMKEALADWTAIIDEALQCHITPEALEDLLLADDPQKQINQARAELGQIMGRLEQHRLGTNLAMLDRASARRFKEAV